MPDQPWRDRVQEIRRIPAGELLANPDNFRLHPEAQQRHLLDGIERDGFAVPVLAYETADGTLMLIDGHLRVKSAPAEQEIPVVVLDVDEAEARRLLVSVDPMAAMAETDRKQLQDLVNVIAGEDESMLAYLAALAQQEHLEAVRAKPGDDVPAAADVEPRSKRGDVWMLGEHRLMCGDATSPTDVGTLLAGEKPMLTITDPPYGVDYDPAWREGVGHAPSRRIGKVVNDDRSDWREAWGLAPGDVLYVWHASLHSDEVGASIRACGFELRAQIIWVKPILPISRGAYHWKHEPMFYAVRKNCTAHWVGDRKQSTVWEIRGSTGWAASEDEADGLVGEEVGGHGTQKPIECMERPMRNHAGDVYDPFVGSGTTIIAAERQARRCFAMDLDPVWVDVALARWATFTEQEPELLGNLASGLDSPTDDGRADRAIEHPVVVNSQNEPPR